ncbi:hypothetical protein AAC387_Pa03g2550 [Persea americana]
MDTVKQTAVSYLITPVVENIMPYLPNFWSGRKELEKLKRLPRENKRMIDRSIREIARERRSLQNQEKKLILEMKKSAKKGQMRAIKVMAKDLIRKRHQMKRSYALKSQLHGVALQIQTMKSTQAIGKAIKGVTKAMGPMNRQMNLSTVQKRMQELERQNERMEMASEVIGDAIDDSLEGDEEDDETEEVTEELVNQVLDEIGIKANDQLAKAPSSAVAKPTAAPKVAQPETAVSEGGLDEDIKARLDNLEGYSFLIT